jgi:hypothetical protein
MACTNTGPSALTPRSGRTPRPRGAIPKFEACVNPGPVPPRPEPSTGLGHPEERVETQALCAAYRDGVSEDRVTRPDRDLRAVGLRGLVGVGRKQLPRQKRPARSPGCSPLVASGVYHHIAVERRSAEMSRIACWILVRTLVARAVIHNSSSAPLAERQSTAKAPAYRTCIIGIRSLRVGRSGAHSCARSCRRGRRQKPSAPADTTAPGHMSRLHTVSCSR